MAHRNIVIVSGILRHAVGAILLCWRRAAWAAGIAGLIGFVATEIVAATLTHHVPATGASQLVALALGAVLAYGAGLTVFADELFIGIRDAVRLLLGEAEAGARAAAILAERETGVGLAAALGRAGLASSASAPERRTGTRSVVPAAATQRAQRAGDVRDSAADRTRRAWRPGDDATGETLAALAPTATPVVEPLAPVIGRPVPAGQLPRIGWIDDPTGPRAQPASTAAQAVPSQTAAQAMPSQTAAPSTRPLPLETEAKTAIARGDVTSDVGTAGGTTAAPGGFDIATPRLAEPQDWHATEASLPTPATWHDPLRGAMDDEEVDGGIRPVDAFGAPPPAAITRPLPENAGPPPEGASPPERESRPSAPRGSVWDHISQVLAGRSVEPLPAEDEEEPSASAEPPASDLPDVGL